MNHWLLEATQIGKAPYADADEVVNCFDTLLGAEVDALVEL